MVNEVKFTFSDYTGPSQAVKEQEEQKTAEAASYAENTFRDTRATVTSEMDGVKKDIKELKHGLEVDAKLTNLLAENTRDMERAYDRLKAEVSEYTRLYHIMMTLVVIIAAALLAIIVCVSIVVVNTVTNLPDTPSESVSSIVEGGE